MSQVMKGNPSLKQAPPPNSRAATHGGSSGMIVGAVINKPVDVAAAAGNAVQASTTGIIQQTLPPGMIAISHQAVAGAPIQLAPQQTPQTNPPSAAPSNSAANMVSVDSASAAVAALSLANTKEKTPMCLINELARFNKISHQYTLTDEQGPAHKKTFFVKLKLGDEEYSASGPSIKKAQHAAADIALEQTQYKHPPLKPPRNMGDGSGRWDSADSITPTVELNALAMKRGEPAVYHPVEVNTPRQQPQFYPPPPHAAAPNMDFRGMYNQRYHYPRAPTVFYVSLKVGQREFLGEGRTRQAARHNAADKALKVLRNLPLPAANAKKDDANTSGNNAAAASVGQATAASTEAEQLEDRQDGLNGLLEQKDALKSEISLVHEIALKRNMPVNFEVTRESGPPHMRTFVTRCSCGELLCDADGNSKKLSKKRAAEKMLDKLRELPGIPAPAINKPKKNPGNKKKNRNLIKVEKATPDYGVGINPISRLIQIQQAKKEKEPVYTLYAERGLPRRREFVMQVTVGDQSCNGVGPNKKLAKRNAAEAMLQLLGYSRPAPQPTKPAIKTSTSGENGSAAASGSTSGSSDKKVTFMDNTQQQQQQSASAGAAASRQLVPGVILMSDIQRAQQANNSSASSYPTASAAASQQSAGAGGMQTADMSVKFSAQTTAAIAKELLDTGASPTAESISKTNAATVASQSVVRPKQQLLYLADVLGFQVQFTDFPKGSSRSEYLSLVSLSTSPPQVSHGAGATVEASHDVAAVAALRALAELGLDAVVPNKAGASASASVTGDSGPVKTDNQSPTGGAGGDGPYIKEEKKLANSKTDPSSGSGGSSSASGGSSGKPAESK